MEIEEMANAIKEKIVFAILAEQCIKQIDGKYMKRKYGITQGKQIGELIRQERIEWMKKNRKKD